MIALWTDYEALMRDLGALPAALSSEQAAAERVHQSEVAAAARGRMDSIRAAERLNEKAGQFLSSARTELDRIDRGQMLPKRVRPEDPRERGVEALESASLRALQLIAELVAEVEGHRSGARERRRTEAEERERIEAERRRSEAAEAVRSKAAAEADARRRAEQARRAASLRRREQILFCSAALVVALGVIGAAIGSLAVGVSAGVLGAALLLAALRHQTQEKE